MLTTYQTVVNDYSGGLKITAEGSSKRKKIESTLTNVIIDEGHQTRNPATKVAATVCYGFTSKAKVWSEAPAHSVLDISAHG